MLDSALTRKRHGRLKKEQVTGLLMSLAPVIGFVIFGLAPMIISIGMSMMKMRGFSFEGAEFIGLKNYGDIFKDRFFGEAVVNTLVMYLSVPITLVLSLLISVLLNKRLAGTKFFRTVFFIPYACSAVALSTMWRWMFNEFGMINNLLTGVFGYLDPETGAPIRWLTDPNYFWVSMIIMSVWSGLGFNIILFSAALGSIPKVYYEAAKIDGASRLRMFFSITFPGISPTTFYLLIMGTIGALQEFARPRVMAGGYSTGKEVTVVGYLYKMFTTNNVTQGMGMASATSLILGFSILLITLANFGLSKRWVHYD